MPRNLLCYLLASLSIALMCCSTSAELDWIESLVDDDDVMVDVQVDDPLSDQSPMLLSAIVSGDIEIMSFEYDDQNRIVAGQYGAILNNEHSTLGVMECRYDQDGMRSLSSLSRVAQYDGEAECVSCDMGEITEVRYETFAHTYTTAELLSYLQPEGLSISLNGDLEAYNYGETISSLSESANSYLDQQILIMANNFLVEIYTSEYSGGFVVCHDSMLYYMFLLSFEYSSDYNFSYMAIVKQIAYDRNFDYDNSQLFSVESSDDARYLSRVEAIGECSVNLPCVDFSGLTVESNGYISGGANSYFDDCYSCESIPSVPIFSKGDIYELLLGADDSPVELIGGGDGFKTYGAYQRFSDLYDLGDVDVYYLDGGEMLVESELDRALYSTIYDEYIVYESGEYVESYTLYTAYGEDDFSTYRQTQLNGDGAEEQMAICAVVDRESDRVGKIQCWEVGSSESALAAEIDYIYDASGRLSSFDVVAADGAAYSDLISIIYDESENPTQIVASSGMLAALNDDGVNELMRYLGVATKRSTLDLETALFSTSYVYGDGDYSSVIGISYNGDYSDFIGDALRSMDLFPMGVTMSSAVEEVAWLGRASCRFTEYSGSVGGGYPEAAKVSIDLSEFSEVEFRYIPMQ